MIAAVIPDRHIGTFGTQRNIQSKTGSKFLADVRRPTRGISIKEDTYAVMQVLLGDGTPIPLVNAGSRQDIEIEGIPRAKGSHGYANFLIQNVQESRAEKQQIIETFGEAFIFLFGERPRIINVSGILINTFDFNWEAEWWFNYDNYLRGTKCVEHDARVYLSYDETLVSGYIIGANGTKEAQERNFIPLQFQMFLADYATLSRLGDPDADQFHRDPVLDPTKYRPTLQPFFPNRPSPVEGISSLADGIRNGIGTIQGVWNKAQEIANNAEISLESFLGNPVRVPVGFEGALVFDEDKSTKEQISKWIDRIFGTADLNTPVRMKVFSENEDEFVTSEKYSQYSGSSIDIGMLLGGTDSMSDDPSATVAKAVAEWASHGFLLLGGPAAKLAALAARTSVGAHAINTVQKGLAQARQEKDAFVSENVAPVVNTATFAAETVATGSEAVQQGRAAVQPQGF